VFYFTQIPVELATIPIALSGGSILTGVQYQPQWQFGLSLSLSLSAHVCLSSRRLCMIVREHLFLIYLYFLFVQTSSIPSGTKAQFKGPRSFHEIMKEKHQEKHKQPSNSSRIVLDVEESQTSSMMDESNDDTSSLPLNPKRTVSSDSDVVMTPNIATSVGDVTSSDVGLFGQVGDVLKNDHSSLSTNGSPTTTDSLVRVGYCQGKNEVVHELDLRKSQLICELEWFATTEHIANPRSTVCHSVPQRTTTRPNPQRTCTTQHTVIQQTHTHTHTHTHAIHATHDTTLFNTHHTTTVTSLPSASPHDTATMRHNATQHDTVLVNSVQYDTTLHSQPETGQ
jgi:hypothetical protein